MTIFPPFPPSSSIAFTVIFSGSSFPNPFFVNEVRRYFSRASFELDISSRSQTSLQQIRGVWVSLLGRRLTYENTSYRVAVSGRCSKREGNGRVPVDYNLA